MVFVSYEAILSFGVYCFFFSFAFGRLFKRPIDYLVGDSTTFNPDWLILEASLGILVFQNLKWIISKLWKAKNSPMYSLQHGRLHLQIPTPMWMNMGYWDVVDLSSEPVTEQPMPAACRDLLKAVLAEAGFSREKEDNVEAGKGKSNARRSKCLIDVGFGCGDQTIYLMSDKPMRPYDAEWWDRREHCVRFDKYIGITKDASQEHYASVRIREMLDVKKNLDIRLFCADAANPSHWTQDLQKSIEIAKETTQEHWLLALDTAYHFSPSRWPLITYANTHLDASFMAFDLCLSESATWQQKLVLRVMTKLMGAPWANFVTIEEYKEKLVQCGYENEKVSIKDVSEHVFGPLAKFIGEHEDRMKMLGLSLGSFNMMKEILSWWARTGVVRGVIVVARNGE